MKSLFKDPYLSLFFILTSTIIAAYFIPELYAYFKLKPFTWETGWDKCTYLSYQGILGIRNMPGTFLLWIVSALQELGIPGSTQALIFDLFLPLLSIFFIYKTFQQLKVDHSTALAYATIILFASVLFNFCNPHIADKFTRISHFNSFLVGFESYPSILRSPNPQFSYFLIALCVLLTVKYKRSFFLLIPMPFLYYFVLVPYVYLLSILFFLFKTKITRSYPSLILIHGLIFCTLALGVWCMFMLMGNSLDFIKNSALFQLGRHPHLNLVGCLGVIIYSLFFLLGLIKKRDLLSCCFLSLIICSFAITNLQLLNNFSLDLKDFQDYGNSIIGGLLLVLSIEILTDWIKNSNFEKGRMIHFLPQLSCFIILCLIARYTLLSQGFNFHTFNFNIYLGATITSEQWEKIRTDPLHAIVLDQQLSEFLPFSHPKMLAPVFSFQYQFPFFEKGCKYNQILAKNAAEFARKNCDPLVMDCASLKQRINNYFKSLKDSEHMPYKNQPYCDKSIYLSKTFYFIDPQKDRRLIVPSWG